ncbi:HTH-type transcriptional regulator RegA [Arthrobacter sp. Hiyo8]|nr:HTH-type transcriptional regulator RegA [Arthrobacter sp. Hiyo8]
MNKSVGIKDVAAAAGVSVTTVSHVLNDVVYARVGAETRERVHEAARRLGYGPNRLAQALRTQRSGMIGFISEEIATTRTPAGSFWGRGDGTCSRIPHHDHQLHQHQLPGFQGK